MAETRSRRRIQVAPEQGREWRQPYRGDGRSVPLSRGLHGGPADGFPRVRLAERVLPAPGGVPRPDQARPKPEDLRPTRPWKRRTRPVARRRGQPKFARHLSATERHQDVAPFNRGRNPPKGLVGDGMSPAGLGSPSQQSPNPVRHTQSRRGFERVSSLDFLGPW